MMGDPADEAQHNVDMFLQASLLKHQNSLKQSGDIEASICQGCKYATKASWGKSCDSWRDCLEDHERVNNAKQRNGNATASV
jgi:hypothetical protein